MPKPYTAAATSHASPRRAAPSALPERTPPDRRTNVAYGATPFLPAPGGGGGGGAALLPSPVKGAERLLECFGGEGPLLPVLLRVLALVCEQELPRLAAAQLVAAHGKVVQCLAEAYPLGVRRSTNAEAVVRAAKLKALA